METRWITVITLDSEQKAVIAFGVFHPDTLITADRLLTAEEIALIKELAEKELQTQAIKEKC